MTQSVLVYFLTNIVSFPFSYACGLMPRTNTYVSLFYSRGMSPSEVECCFRQILSGVGYLHSQGVAHRDIKPENLFFDAKGNLKVRDPRTFIMILHPRYLTDRRLWRFDCVPFALGSNGPYVQWTMWQRTIHRPGAVFGQT